MVDIVFPKKRIEFIDLAKGVCILLVVILHCGGPARMLPGFELVRMPLYFILSGLFYKDYGGIKYLVIKKTNKLIIPYLFFLIVPYILLFPIYGKGMINNPIWFLLSLFWCNIIFFYINKFIKKEILKILTILVVATFGYWWLKKWSYTFFYIDISLSALPFFCIGYYLKKSSILYRNKYDRYNLLFFVFFWILSVLLYKLLVPSLDFNGRLISGIDAYFTSFCSVMSILFLCKSIRWIPLISYIGRYSIVILCTHFFFILIWIKYLKFIPPIIQKWWLLFIIIMFLSTLCIPLFLKFIPEFIAQKDIITIDVDHKIKGLKSGEKKSKM